MRSKIIVIGGLGFVSFLVVFLFTGYAIFLIISGIFCFAMYIPDIISKREEKQKKIEDHLID
ncbi:MAG: hypothetical protein R2824_09665 [Saprospiraceae bacterium]|nr:hypothetical protein [Lewinella sp.]